MDDARTDVQAAGACGFSLTVKRNCSISPRALGWLLVFTGALSFGIGVAFALYGAWPVLPFVGLEVAALAAAFYVNGRHATDYERIALADGSLVVEIRDGGRLEEHRFNPHWVRLVVSDARRDVRLALRSHARELEIGRHLDASGREQLATELRGRLAAAS
jgi:uncharacterized membrane protein